MSVEPTGAISPRMQTAVDELEEVIRKRYPRAEFQVMRSQDDPEIVHLRTLVDVEDTDDVIDLVIDRMMELQIDDGLPLYVIPIRPVGRMVAEMRRQLEHPLPNLPRLEEPILSAPEQGAT